MNSTAADSLRPYLKLLKGVSRSFYLTLRVLPASIRPPIGLAYLLARATDTIADTELVALGRRQAALGELQARILGQAKGRLDLTGWIEGGGQEPEKALLRRLEEILDRLEQSGAADRELIRQVLGIIISGQELDLTRFGDASARQIASLQTDSDLDDYTYRVAGCVGEFWTRVCLAHLFSEREVEPAWMLAQGIRFGKGLQLVNILRDIAADLRRGRCYLPLEELRKVELAPADLLSSASASRFNPLYQGYLAKAEAHLAAGWAYTNALPRRCLRVRLACAWPILIGTKTLEKLAEGEVLVPGRTIKVRRAEVRRIMVRSLVYYPWPSSWQRLYLIKNQKQKLISAMFPGKE
ncbi:MAG: squalene/phytoene synthase family protein [Candidatus Omnitrophica bacterium]|nr:squalene/phytoene synthase family protein [Candidatus Omnitrophota bacterium]